MTRILRTRQSRADYNDIFSLAAAKSPDIAEKIVRTLDEHVFRLARSTLHGESCPKLGVGVSAYPVRGFTVFYRPSASGLLLLRVLRGNLDIDYRLLR